uniref:Uncharacterized protein n=1 Tax=Canis lupus familiaris TaxID=9615 RepID=A0A8P0TMD2_CANLF
MLLDFSLSSAPGAQRTTGTASRRQFASKVPEKQRCLLLGMCAGQLLGLHFPRSRPDLSSSPQQLVPFHPALPGPLIDEFSIYRLRRRPIKQSLGWRGKKTREVERQPLRMI